MTRFFKKSLKKEIADLSGQILTEILANKKLMSAMESCGIKDGEEIILEFLTHREIGLAYEHLEYVISESRIELTTEHLTRLKYIEQKLKKLKVI